MVVFFIIFVLKGVVFLGFKKLGVFKSVNILMVIVCLVTACFNFVNTKVVTTQKAQSYIGDDVYDFNAEGNTLEFSKNGKLINKVNTNKRIKFMSNILPFQSDAFALACKALGAGFAAMAVGGNFGAAFSTAFMSAVGNVVGGAAMSGAAVSAAVPGEAALAATLGGAGEVAAAAAAAESAALAGASIATIASTILVPVLVGALGFSAIA